MQQTDNLGNDILSLAKEVVCLITFVVATDKGDCHCGLETLVVIKRQKRGK